jgi:F0F1-type ATP synthase assembly protein I
MAKDILEKADEQVAESIRKLTRATSAMADAIYEGTNVIKHAVKRSGDVAEELLDDATQRVKRHPIETMAATFTLGVIVGGFIGWLVSRR